MSTLSDKILSYSPEYYIRLNTAYSNTPPNLGSLSSSTWTLSNEAPVLIPNGGPDGEGCWEFNMGAGNDTSTTRFQATSSGLAAISPWTDGDFSTGLWFRFTSPLTTSSPHSTQAHTINITRFKSNSTVFYLYGGSANNANKGGLYVVPQVGAASIHGKVDDGAWHYIATRIKETSSGVYDYEIYLDGTLIKTLSGGTWTASTIYSNTFGASSGAGTTAWVNETIKMQVSNHYTAPYTAITSTEIAEIWTAGIAQPSTNVTITETPATATALMVDPTISVNSNALLSETPATASALMTEPTIIITSPDYTEITTSILVSAEFPSNTNVSAEKNVNNVIAGTLDASADIINNVVITSGTNVDYVAAEMTASAELIEPLPSIEPMFATALMVNPTVSVNPNYRRLVKQLNPSIYIHDPEYVTGDEKPFKNPNDGYENWSTPEFDNGVFRYQSPAPLDICGNGYSFGASANSLYNTNREWGFLNATAQQQSQYFNTPGQTYSNDWTLEFWYYPRENAAGGLIDLGNAQLRIGTDTNQLIFSVNTDEIANDGYIGFEQIVTQTFTPNNWYHIVVTLNISTGLPNAVSQIWINGAIKGTYSGRIENASFDSVQEAIGINVNYSDVFSGFFNEIALYKQVLSNADILEHYTFMLTNSPNVIHSSDVMIASAQSGDHNFLVTSNVNNAESPAIASGLIVNPSIIAQKNLVVFATPLEASALNTDAEVYWGWTIVATPAVASAFKPEAYFLKTTYSNYVQANIAPYRYVTFDAADTAFDYGTDNDYSVAPTVVGGTIVNPDLGINGKSAKTAGTSYVTDGVILKESEWDDSWGTGQNSYHSAFWFQRALDDASTTGLRVLWNLNGYKDNQHVVLYQYQGKMHMQFNNGSGTWIEQDTGALDLFDYQRHFIVIDFNHTNPVNNVVSVYVDAILKMTIDLGAYTGSTTNASSADSGPNDELNNHPRLGVGCLITPFAATALPVVPTNTKLIIDEIYWDKNAINQTTVTNLFNIMPDKDNVDFIAEAMTAADELVMPAYSTSSNLVTAPFIASIELVEPLTTADREVIYNSGTMTADALMEEALLFEDRILAADLFIASAIFNDAGVIISIPGGPMLATATLATNIGFKHYDDDGDFINIIPLSDNLTPLIRYVRVDALNNRIPNLMEVK